MSDTTTQMLRLALASADDDDIRDGIALGEFITGQLRDVLDDDGGVRTRH